MKKFLLTLPVVLLSACGQLGSAPGSAVGRVSPIMVEAMSLCRGHAVIVRYSYSINDDLYLGAGQWIDATADGRYAIYRWSCYSTE